MKTQFIIILALLFIACTDSEEKVNIDIKQTSFTFTKDGGSDVLDITANTAISVKSTETTWCEVAMHASSPGSYQYKVTVEANTLAEARQAGITVTAKGFEKQIPVDQAPGDAIEPAPEPEKFTVREKLTTQQLVNEMGLGINLGNTLDASGNWFEPTQPNYETCWGSPIITKEIIEGYARAGYSSLRIPVTWSNMMADDYTIHPDLMDRVETILNWTLDCGMVAIINVHHENEWVKEAARNDEARKKFTSVWQQITKRFEKYGDHLMFEPMNEIGFDDVWTPWGGSEADKAKAFGYVNDLNQLFVDIVRASGGNNAKRHLLVEIYNTGDAYAYDPLTRIPTDPANRLALTVHYYAPAQFAILGNGEDAGWGVGVPSWGTDQEFKELNDAMEALKINCVDKGIPVIVGEYACSPTNRTQEVVRLYCVSVTEAIYKNGMCPMFWDVPGAGQYERTTCEFKDPIFLEEMMAIPAKYPRN